MAPRETWRLNPGMIEAIVEAVAAGVPPHQAGAALGVAQRTWHDWMQYGRLPNAKGLRRELVERIDEAAAKAARGMLAQLHKTARGGAVVKRHTRTTTRRDGTQIVDVDETVTAPDWRAFAWMLERRFPEEFRSRNAPVIGNVIADDEKGEVSPEALRAKVSSIFDQMERRRVAREAVGGDLPAPSTNGSPNGSPPS